MYSNALKTSKISKFADSSKTQKFKYLEKEKLYFLTHIKKIYS